MQGIGPRGFLYGVEGLTKGGFLRALFSQGLFEILDSKTGPSRVGLDTKENDPDYPKTRHRNSEP